MQSVIEDQKKRKKTKLATSTNSNATMLRFKRTKQKGRKSHTKITAILTNEITQNIEQIIQFLSHNLMSTVRKSGRSSVDLQPM